MRRGSSYHGDGLQFRRLDLGQPIQAPSEVLDDARDNESAELAVRDAERVDVSWPEEGANSGRLQGGRTELHHERNVMDVGT